LLRREFHIFLVRRSEKDYLTKTQRRQIYCALIWIAACERRFSATIFRISFSLNPIFNRG
jgi:hypothetical protein